MNRRFPLARLAKTTLAGAALLLLTPSARAAEAGTPGNDPLPGRAGEFALKIEPGVAIPLTRPQSQLFETGGGQTVKALWSLNRSFDVGPSATVVVLPTGTASGDFGTGWGFGGSLRYKRPHDLSDNAFWYAASPWVDADALYVRTGKLNRPGFAAAAGVSFAIGAERVFWVGPFVRYFHIVQLDRSGFDNHDGKILLLGVSLEVGSSVRRPQVREVVREAAAPAEVRTVIQETVSCPDRDGDGVPENVDPCPDVAGPWENHGCPPYKKIVVKPDKLELKERLYFAWDRAEIQEASFPMLDEVVQALKDNKSFRVQVQGHASSEGAEDHNQTLSEKRAEAVLDYLAAHGIARDRLGSKGFSSSVPAGTNVTQAGREKNRRVEFVVSFIILNDGSK